MVCFHPITGNRVEGGQVKFSGYAGWQGRPITIACGQCWGCKLERSRQWAVRCMHEVVFHERSSFITLTYRDEELPRGGSLDVKDWQRFAKRLRKSVGPFRYFHCGEYGDRYGRPHYHACLFGLDFMDDRELWKVTRDVPLWTSKTLSSVWGHGHAVIGEVTFESAAYVARYIMKKRTGDQAAAWYGGRKPEYTTMSRNPGLGAKWIEKWGDEVYPDDFIVVNGKRSRPPRFYDSQFEIFRPEEMDKIKELRKEKAKLHEKDTTGKRLLVREKVSMAKMSLYSRGEL